MQKHRTAIALATAAGLLVATSTIAAAQDQPVSQGGFAVIDSDGTLLQKENVKRVQHPNTGVYQIKFNQPVTSCAANGTVAGDTANGAFLPAYIVVTKLGRGTLQVNTYSTVTLLAADTKFDLALTC